MKPAVHPFQTDDPRLHAIHEKVLAGQQLKLGDVTALFASKDILAIGWLANYVRERMHGNATQFRVDTIEAAQATQPVVGEADGSEFLVLGGDVDRVCKAVTSLKKNRADVSISALTVEQLAGSGAKEAISKLRDAGVSSLLGGGAEVFLPALRKALWQSVSTAEHRAEVRALAAAAELKVPAYVIQRPGSPEEQAKELLSFREVQADAFASISFDPDASTSPNLVVTTGMQEMKQIAIARLALTQIPQIRAYWHMLGGKLVQIALRFGASYLDGTSLEPSVTQAERAKELAREIQVAGREPHEIASSRRVVLAGN